MIEVELPDGRVLEFPDGTPPEVMTRQAKVATDEFTGRDFLRHATSGATFDFADELGGLAFGAMDQLGGTGNFWESYDRYRDAERAEMDLNREAHPVASLMSELGGGLATGVAGGAKVAGTRGGQALQQFAGQSVRNRLGAGMAAGAGGGGLQGAGMAPEASDIPLSVVQGAGIGAATGGLMEGGVAGVRRVARNLSDPVARGDRALRRGIRRGLETPDQIRAKLRKMGPNTMLADVNDGLTAELEKIAQTPGAAKTRVENRLMARNRKQLGVILEESGEGDYWGKLDELKESRSTKGKVYYDEAMAQGVRHTQELESVFNGLRATYPDFWQEAKRIGKAQFVGDGVPIPDLGRAPRLTLEGWNAVKKSLWDRGQELWRAGAKEEAHAVDAIRHRLVRELDNQNSKYKKARDFWAGTREFEDMMEDGLTFMNKNVSASKFRHIWKHLSESEKLAYSEGARQSIQDILEKAGETHNLTKFFNSPQVKYKIMTMFGRNEGARFLRKVMSEARKHTTLNKTLGNSSTAYRQALQQQDSLGPDVLAGLADFAFYGSPVGAAGGIARRAARRAGMRESTRDELSRLLTETDPAEVQRILDDIYKPGGRGGPVSPLPAAVPFISGAAGAGQQQ
jgi:hypothetical protein